MLIITSKTRSRWRIKEGSKFRSASRREVTERAREVIESGGSERDAQNAVRELTMYNTSPARCWENFADGCAAAEEAIADRTAKLGKLTKTVDGERVGDD